LVGLIVNSMQDAHHQADIERTDQHREDVIQRLIAIEARLADPETRSKNQPPL
jgi:voltage-gated sodium channel